MYGGPPPPAYNGPTPSDATCVSSIRLLHVATLTHDVSRFRPPDVPSQGVNFAAPSSTASPVPTTSALGKLAPGQSVEKLLDPPPPCFSRPPPPALPHVPFQPMSLFCRGATLDKGFLEIAPPSSTSPHPFLLYDVTEEDWHWFLYTVKISASLSPLNRVVAGAAPMALGLGMLGSWMVGLYTCARN